MVYAIASLRRPVSRRTIGLLAYLALFATVAALIRLDQPTLIDETEWHIRAIAVFLADFPAVDIRNFGGVGIASGPVPYIIWAAWGKLLSLPGTLDALPWYRLVTLLASMGGVAVVWRMARDVAPSQQLLVVGFAALMPYYFLGSFTIYTQVIALSFGLAALLFYRAYLASARTVHLLAAVALAVLAVASRQVFLAYAVGLLADHVLRPWLSRAPRRRTYARDLALLLIPVAVLGGLFILWGGTVPPPAYLAEESTRVNWLQPNFALIVLGFWFLPVWLQELKAAPVLAIVLALAFAANLLFAPHYAVTSEEMDGVVPSLLQAAGDFGVPELVLRLGQAALCFGGILVLYRAVREVAAQVDDAQFAFAALAHLGVLMVVPLVWERYYLPVVPVLWLLFRRRVHAGWLYPTWLVLQAALTGTYFVYKLYIQ